MWKIWKDKRVYVNHREGTSEVEVVSFPSGWGKPTTEERDQWKSIVDLSTFDEAEIVEVFVRAPFMMTLAQLKSAFEIVDGLSFTEQAAALLYLRTRQEHIFAEQRLERGL